MYVLGQIDQFVGITTFVVIPRDDFVEARIEFHTRVHVENGSSDVSNEILGN
jgi:hypothetical protein